MADQIVDLNLLQFLQPQANANANPSEASATIPHVYLYKGGPVPRHVTRIRIDKSIQFIPDEAFSESNVQEVEMHNGVYKIGGLAFYNCRCLERISGATGVRVVDEGAFFGCRRLKDVEFGKKLERIGQGAFSWCKSLRGLKIPSVKIVDRYAFQYCVNMTNVEFGEGLEQMGEFAFLCCYSLQRVAMPLKGDLISDDNVFNGCGNLANIELVGAVHNTLSHFSMQVWRDEMNDEIDRINQVLSDISAEGKTVAVRQWIRTAHARVQHFTNEHNNSLEECATLLELALWRDHLNDEPDDNDSESSLEAKPKKKARIDSNSARKERRMTCGANVVIKNVLPFLQLK